MRCNVGFTLVCLPMRGGLICLLGRIAGAFCATVVVAFFALLRGRECRLASMALVTNAHANLLVGAEDHLLGVNHFPIPWFCAEAILDS